MIAANIRRFADDEWKIYRDTRLSALKDSPDAFGGTHEGSSRLSDDEWKNRLSTVDPQYDLPLAAVVAADIIGMAWVHFENSDDETAHLYQMWVSEKFRGNGVARQLLSEAISWAKGQGAKSMSLNVTCGDTSARRLYDSMDFSPEGIPGLLREGSTLKMQEMKKTFF